MTDNEAPQGDTQETAGEQEQTAETDWKAEARKWESRAKENLRNARANEGAAQRLAELEESQKTEAQKTADRLAAAEKRAAELESKAVRAEVAADKGVPVALLSGSTREELEASADALIAFKGEQQKNDFVLPDQGRTPGKAAGSTADSFARFLEDRLS